MSSANTLLLMQSLIVLACTIAALAALWFGSRLLRPERRHAWLGSVLMLSSLGWGALAYCERPGNDSALVLASLQDLPATAAGLNEDWSQVDNHPSTDTTVSHPPSVASVATLAEEIAAQPQGADFQQLRNRVTQMLFTNADFDRYPNPVLINLPTDRESETIRYLAEERPGLLTVIYHTENEGEKRVLVYWPEVAGNQLIYTPLMGPSSQAMTKLVQEIMTN